MGYTSKFTGAEIDNLLSKVQEGGSGGGVPIVSSEAELDVNAPVGSLAVVAKESTLKEGGFNDLYQATADIMDNESGALTTPELLSNVPSITFLAPEGEIVGSKVDIYIVPRSFSMTNAVMITLQIVVSNNIVTSVGGMSTVGGYKFLTFIEYANGIPTVNQADIDEINNILKTDDWCYLGSVTTGFVLTEGQKATLDKFFRIISGEPASQNLYIKKEDYIAFATKEETEALDGTINQVSEAVKEQEKTIATLATKDEMSEIDQRVEENASSISTLDNKVHDNYLTFERYNPETGEIRIGPNKYYRYRNIRNDITLKFINPDYTDTVSEYIVELQFSEKVNLTLPSGIVWLNDISPVADIGKTIVISVINFLGVCAEFNS